MAKLHGSFIWYELMTPDPLAAREFYEKFTGWTITADPVSADMDYRLISRPDGMAIGGVLGLSQAMLADGAKPGWIGYIGVDDCDQAVMAVAAAGGKVIMPGRDVPHAGRIALVEDCCGAAYYLMTPTPQPGGGESAAFSPDALGSCGWNELRTSNQERAMAYYTGLYGWSWPESFDLDALGLYQTIEHDGVRLGASLQQPAHIKGTSWVPYFRVADIDAALQTIEATGVSAMMSGMDIPGDDWIINGVDPQGVFFALVGRKA